MAFAAVERLIAFRYLRARREEGFISVIAGFSLIGITLGVGTLIVMRAVMNGFRVEMLRQMSSISGQLGVQGNRGAIEATPDLLKRLADVPGVMTAAPSVEGQLMAVAGDRVRGVILRGMTAQDLRNRQPHRRMGSLELGDRHLLEFDHSCLWPDSWIERLAKVECPPSKS